MTWDKGTKCIDDMKSAHWTFVIGPVLKHISAYIQKLACFANSLKEISLKFISPVRLLAHLEYPEKHIEFKSNASLHLNF